jgi:hypothetical protein
MRSSWLAATGEGGRFRRHVVGAARVSERAAAAAARALRFLSTPGDHLTTLMVHGAESARGVCAFLDAA